MSLPSYAFFYKNDVEVGKCFVNCGWAYDEIETLNQVLKFLNQNPLDYDHFRVYSETYSFNRIEISEYIVLLKEERVRLSEIRKEIENHREERTQIVSPEFMEAVARIRRTIPENMAKEILGVQPIQDNVIDDLREALK